MKKVEVNAGNFQKQLAITNIIDTEYYKNNDTYFNLVEQDGTDN